MSDSAAPQPPTAHPAGHHHQSGIAKLAVGAIGVVYGDIGTSPLYAMKESFIGRIRWRSIGCTSSACSA